MLAALHLFVSAMVVAACSTEAPTEGAPHQASAGAAAGPQLCLELHAPREPVQLGEPISILASLLNCSRSQQQVQDLLSPEFGFLQVWIREPEGKELLHRPVSIRDARGKPVVPLAPGARLSAFVPIYFGADGWTIEKPGRYGVRAQYSGGHTKLESKPVHVTVIPPQKNADRHAAALMMTREAGMLLTSGRDERGEGSRRLTAIAEQYGESHLAPYARLALAIADTRDRFDPATKSFAKNGCERMTPQLARTVPQIGDPALAAAGTVSWVRCLRQLGRNDEVAGAVSALLRSHPEARHVPAIEQLADPARKDRP